jgi:IS30 family transposase
MILFTEYFKLHGRRENAARHLLAVGRFKTAQKIKDRWYIDEAEPYPDSRDFTNLSLQERQLLETYMRKGFTKAECARRLGYNRSTITREVRRGTYEHTTSELLIETRYSCDKAQKDHEEHFSAMGAQLKIGNDRELADYIENKIINEKRAPASILGEIEREGLKFKTHICTATLYSYIDKCVFLNVRREHLPEGGKRKRTYKKVIAKRPPRGTSIEKRPAEVETRETAGHWEMDTCKGAQGTKESLLVFTERKTRYELIFPLRDGTSASVVSVYDALERQLGSLFPLIFRTVTVDNGSENSDFTGLQTSILGGERTKIYYCYPYRSSERGSNENQNRQIRRRIPKGSRLADYSAADIAAVETWINTNPRRIHDWKTAAQMFERELFALDVDANVCLRAFRSQFVYN